MSVQAKGEPAASVQATIQTPKAMIPTEIKSESTVSMIGPLLLAWHAIEREAPLGSLLIAFYWVLP
jgi:hypothetical protein